MPFEAKTRWHGRIMAIGFFAMTLPTALAAFGLPAARATSAYVMVFPAGMLVYRFKHCALEGRHSREIDLILGKVVLARGKISFQGSCDIGATGGDARVFPGNVDPFYCFALKLDHQVSLKVF